MKNFTLLQGLKKTRVALLLFFNLIAVCLSAQENLPQVKIDLNMSGRPAAEVQEPGWTPWAITNGGPDSMKVSGVEFIFRKGARGNMLAMTYYKVGVQTPNLARLTCDGMFVKDGDFNLGSEIQLTLRGLPAGTHQLTTYHNATDNLNAATVCPIDVYVNDVLTINDLVPSIRVFKESECARARLTFTAEAGRDVVIRFKAEESGAQPVKNVYINAVSLNVINPDQQSRTPNPAHRDEHVATPGNTYKLGWQIAPAAISHDIYFGKDSAAVANADRNSPLFKGNQLRNDSSYTIHDLYSMDTYYWRVDEIDTTGTYKGNIWMFRPQQLAFKGAEGYGRFARGGRGGKVVEVTNLNDDGPGSLRWAITNDIGPRTIVFAVSGIIQLKSRLVLAQPYVTVAGQTAPGKGICISRAPFGAGGTDDIIRFVRVRVGSGTTYDGMGMNGDHSIIDHCSISWTIDEGFSSRGAKNITLQRTMIAEALNIAGHQNYPPGSAHGYAATISGLTGSFHHNLLAHNSGRNWSLGAPQDGGGNFASRMDITNNVVYNWVNRTTDGGVHKLNFVNNYYKPGPASKYFYALKIDEAVGIGTQQAFFSGNMMPGYFNESNQERGRTSPLTVDYQMFVDTPFFPSHITSQSARDAYKQVLSDVGANQPFFDDHDARIVRETLTGSYTYRGSIGKLPGIVDSSNDVGSYENYPALTRTENWDSDHDGLPNWWEQIHGFNFSSAAGDFSESNGDPDHDGVTNLDEYLDWMAAPHYLIGEGESVDLNLRSLSRGFDNAPVFTISNNRNGAALMLNDSIARFTASAAGLASFTFTVTDAEGSAMTRTVGIVADKTFSYPALSSFEARRLGMKEVALQWKTTQEINSTYFVVFRSTDANGRNAIAIDTIRSKVNGDSLLAQTYDYIDSNALSIQSYYHVVQFFSDGRSRPSAIRSVKGYSKVPVLKVWPVPSSGVINVSVESFYRDVNIEVIDALGRPVLSRKLADNSVTNFYLNRKGIYWLRVTGFGTVGTILYSRLLIIL